MALTRVLLADDQALVRLLLRHAIARRPGLEIVGEAENGAEALRLPHELAPDIAVLDVSMPALDGLQVAARLRETHPACWILVFSASGGPDAEAKALAAGADIFVDKARGFDVAADAVAALSARGPRA